MLYSLVVAVVCSSISSWSATSFVRSKWSYLVALIFSTMLAILINVAVLFLMAKLYPDAPFDGASGGRMAANSFWAALVLSWFGVLSIRRRQK